MSAVQRTVISCGVKQLYSLHEHDMTFDGKVTPVDIEKHIFPVVDEGGCAFIVFSDHEKLMGESEMASLENKAGNHQGRRLAAFIRENGLGTVTETSRAVNPNTGNGVRVWVWEVDWLRTRYLVSKYRERKLIEAREAKQKTEQSMQSMLGSETISITGLMEDGSISAEKTPDTPNPVRPLRKDFISHKAWKIAVPRTEYVKSMNEKVTSHHSLTNGFVNARVQRV